MFHHASGPLAQMLDASTAQSLRDVGHTLDLSEARVGRFPKKLAQDTRAFITSRFVAVEIGGKQAPARVLS